MRQIVTMPFGFMIAFDIVLGIIVGLGFFISAWRKGRKKNYAALPNTGKDMDGDDIELLTKGASNQQPEDHDDLSANPDFQVFIRYISRLIKTKDIGLSFDFEGLEFEPTPGKKILKGVSGSIQSGSMWAVMGGSGAGKSTFFNVLMGKTRHTGGVIKVNGHPKDMAKYKKLIGFVPQDDIVIPELTVRENILHSARCRLPMSWGDKDIQAYVDALISCIGLSHVQHSLVGDATKPVVSGGQRKRVSIGMELAAAPMCIFLDEPTSGLDATSASSIMRLLKAITKLGVTTITIIHQPREQIFHGFDNILLLGLGNEIYAGPTSEAPVYFDSLGFKFPSRANPADVIMDIINGEGYEYRQDHAMSETPVARLIENWRNRHQRAAPTQAPPRPQHLLPEDSYSSSSDESYQDVLAAPKRPRPVSVISTADQEAELKKTMKKRGASWYAQVYYCCKRSITQQVRLKNSFFFEIGTGAFAGGIIGLSAFTAEGQLFKGIYQGSFLALSHATNYVSAPQLGLLGAMAIGLAASAPAVKVFGEEKLIFNREASSGHSMSAYYVGKMVSVLPRLFIANLHFSVFMGILATPLMSWIDMFIANLLYFFCVYGLASCVGMLVKREDGPLLAVMCSLIIGILGGVAPPLSKVKDWHVEVLWRMSPGVWFTESYFSQNLLPLDYLYTLNFAEQATGFNLGKFGLDMG
jgi:ABC-type multidrug transport system ATPase subunit